MIREFFGRLYARTMLVAVLVFAALAGTGMALLYKYEQSSTVLLTTSRIGNLSARVAALLGAAASAGNAEIDEAILELLLSERAVLCVEVTAANAPHAVLAQAPADAGCKGQSRAQRIVLNLEGAHERQMAVYFSEAIASAGSDEGNAATSLVLLAALLITVVATSLAFGLRVGRPLSRLHKTVLRRGAAGAASREQGEPRPGRDELEELSLAFERMIDWEDRREQSLRDEQAKLARLNAELEQRVQERTQELAAALEDVLASSEAKSRFVATMSHEVRTPLNAVIGMASLLEDRPIDAQSRDYLKVIRQAAEQLLAIVNDVLDFSRLESSAEQLVLRDIDLRHLVGEVAQIGQALADRNGVPIVTHIDPALPAKVRGDPLRVRQLLLNLLGNAAKFTRCGTIQLTVERSDEPADPHHAHLPGLRFSVIDTGPGIPAAFQSRIFDPFEQGAHGALSPTRGSGLGLAICKRIAALLGGSLSLDSAEGRGSTFTFTMPLMAGDDERSAASPPAGGASYGEVPAREGLRVLVAEDTPASQMVIRLILERLGHSVRIVENGRQALAAFDEEPFDAIFLDVQMPVMDGYEAARALRERKGAGTSIPIVGLSAFSQSQDRQRAFGAGMSHYLAKPVRLADVAAVMRELPAAASALEPV